MEYTEDSIDRISKLFSAVLIKEMNKICSFTISKDFSELIIGFSAYKDLNDFDIQVNEVRKYLENNYNLIYKKEKLIDCCGNIIQKKEVSFYFSKEQLDKLIGYFKAVYNMKVIFR